MAIRIVPYEPRFESAAREFDARLSAQNALPFSLGGAPDSSRVPPPGIQYRHFLAVDAEGSVRGGYFIRTQPLLVQGIVQSVGHYSAPLSEGIIDKRYTAVGPMMLSHALKQQPLLFAMGMGGMDRPLPRMLGGMGWTVREVPFFFLVLNASRFLRYAGPLQKPGIRPFARALAFSGLGALAVHAGQWLRTRPRTVTAEAFPAISFDSWADTVSRASAGMYSFAAVRDSAYLNFLFPRASAPFHPLRLVEAGETIAWTQVLDCTPHNKSYFGAMKVSALIDGEGPERSLPALVDAAVRLARANGADLLFSNQMHSAWRTALRNAGFWSAPSNYLLALSKELTALLRPLDESLPRIHFNRGDGDGIVNLISSADAH